MKQSDCKLGIGLFVTLLFCASISSCSSSPVKASPTENQNLYLPSVSADEILIQPTPQAANWWQPIPGTSWQIQFSGALETSLEVQMYDFDLFDTPQTIIDQLHKDGHIVICYFSAGSWEDWRPDANQFPEAVIGKKLDNWPGENWLDIRQLEVLNPIMSARLDLAVHKGCEGVDPDNVDGYANDTGFPLNYADQLAYNTWLAEQAHQRGLAIGLKNDLDQVSDLLPYFDWALNEECFSYNECHLLQPFITANKAVFGIEYDLSTEDFCPQANAFDFDFLKKNWDLDAWRAACR